MLEHRAVIMKLPSAFVRISYGVCRNVERRSKNVRSVKNVYLLGAKRNAVAWQEKGWRAERSLLLQLPLFQVAKESGTCIFEQIEDVLEAAVTAVVGVGNMVGVVLGAPLGHAMDLAFQFEAGAAIVQVVYVLIVHTDDEVEVAEVAFADGTREVGDVVAATQGMLTHTGIGSLALMVADDAGRVDVILVGESLGVDEVLHDGLRRTTAANVTKTNEEDAKFFVLHSLVKFGKSATKVQQNDRK